MKKIIFIITIFLTIISSAHAATATLVKHRIEDYYVYYYDKSQERERYIYANRYVFGTTTAYCLELGKDISSNIYTYSTAFEELPYDKDTLDYIKIVAYYGYDYPGHNTVEYYMAAQELIWEKISDVDVTWVDGVLTTNYVNIESEKNTIKNQIEEHYKLPSFDRIQIDYTLGESLTIEDTNNVLNKFETTVENVIIDGNKLIITEDFDEEEIILTHPNYTGNKFLFYTSGTSQKMMSTGVINDEVKSIIKIKMIMML